MTRVRVQVWHRRYGNGTRTVRERYDFTPASISAHMNVVNGTPVCGSILSRLDVTRAAVDISLDAGYEFDGITRLSIVTSAQDELVHTTVEKVETLISRCEDDTHIVLIVVMPGLAETWICTMTGMRWERHEECPKVLLKTIMLPEATPIRLDSIDSIDSIEFTESTESIDHELDVIQKTFVWSLAFMCAWLFGILIFNALHIGWMLGSFFRLN